MATRLLGHKTANMFLRYDVAAIEDLAEAVAVAEPKLRGARGDIWCVSLRGRVHLIQ